MPPTLGGAQLELLSPTAAEISQAKAIIAQSQACPRDMRAKMSSMSQWLKKFPDEKASNSRGEQRVEYLQNFLIHQLRAKNAQKKALHSAGKSHTTNNIAKTRWWNKERMDKELGATKGAAIRNRPNARCKPCRYTGSEDPELVEYAVVSDEENEINEDTTSFKVNTAADATEADLKLLDDMHSATASSSADGAAQGAQDGDAQYAPGKVKQEPKSEQEKLQAKFEEFMANVRGNHWNFTNMQLDIADMDARLGMQKWTEELRAALKKHAARTATMVRLLLKATTERPKIKEFHKLESAMSHILASQNEFVKSAAKFGVLMGKSKKRRTA